MGERSDSGESKGAEKGAFTVSSSRVPDPPKPDVGAIGTAKLAARDINSNSGRKRDSMETKEKDVGGFKVSSSRVPDVRKPDISSISTSKIAAKDIKERQR